VPLSLIAAPARWSNGVQYGVGVGVKVVASAPEWLRLPGIRRLSGNIVILHEQHRHIGEYDNDNQRLHGKKRGNHPFQISIEHYRFAPFSSSSFRSNPRRVGRP
jgi:hypothetical protein